MIIPDGYRILEFGETILETDLVYHKRLKEFQTNEIYTKTGERDRVSQKFHETHWPRIRRIKDIPITEEEKISVIKKLKKASNPDKAIELKESDVCRCLIKENKIGIINFGGNNRFYLTIAPEIEKV